jgi:stringent starvation protein B
MNSIAVKTNWQPSILNVKPPRVRRIYVAVTMLSESILEVREPLMAAATIVGINAPITFLSNGRIVLPVGASLALAHLDIP